MLAIGQLPAALRLWQRLRGNRVHLAFFLDDFADRLLLQRDGDIAVQLVPKADAEDASRVAVAYLYFIEALKVGALAAFALHHDTVDFTETVEVRSVQTAVVALQCGEDGLRRDAGALTLGSVDVDHVLGEVRVEVRLCRLDFRALYQFGQGYSYEFSGQSREEQSSSGNTTGIVFVLCFVFIYLLLSAQYESYILPFSVLLSVPFGLAGSFIFIHAMGGLNSIIPIFGQAANNIYVQIALIMLMGLLAKNAILIVEFALDRRKMGMSITWAAVLGAGARLRPILMTSMAMIIGLLPMMFAFGVGANGNRALGTTAIGGMLIGMILQIYIVPVLFVIFQSLQEKLTPMHWDDVENSGEAVSDIEQYSK